jgi:hypothetical protein
MTNQERNFRRKDLFHFFFLVLGIEPRVLDKEPHIFSLPWALRNHHTLCEVPYLFIYLLFIAVLEIEPRLHTC